MPAPWANDYYRRQRRKERWSFVLTALVAMAILAMVYSFAQGADARNIRVVDGDTFDCDAYLGFGLSTHMTVSIRIEGFDAWEVSKRRGGIVYASDEFTKGEQAKAALKKLLSEAEHVGILDTGKNSFERRRCWVYVDGKEVGAIMRAAGHERTTEPTPAATEGTDAPAPK